MGYDSEEINRKAEDILRKSFLPARCQKDAGPCPSDIEMADFISNNMAPEVRERISEHVLSCAKCFNTVAISLKALNGEDYPVYGLSAPSVLARKRAAGLARANKGGRLKAFLKRNSFMVIGCIFLALSFAFKKYFMQLLLVSGICGIKWVMDTGSTKALIMIYDTWRNRKEYTRDDDMGGKDSRGAYRPGSKNRL
ncbi:MAG: hypothetical protein PHV77_02400 [Candidatus Omnitrophica bacterium]|jgi:hypothetical protein|nr:hypothetical protein [Candidatus Omnitrophota bacterium]